MRGIDYTGKRFNRLTALKVSGRTKRGGILWLCKCLCGTEKIVAANNLSSGATQSCGCLRRESTAKTFTIHGYRKNNKQYYLYQMWLNIKGRCCKKDHQDFKNYGARGIKIDVLWLHNFKAFADWVDGNLGLRPSGFSIDRIDNDGNYEPGNLRWADASIQRKNQRF